MSFILNRKDSGQSFGYIHVDVPVKRIHDCNENVLVFAEPLLVENVEKCSVADLEYDVTASYGKEKSDDNGNIRFFEVDIKALEEYNYAKSWIGVVVAISLLPSIFVLSCTSIEFISKYWVVFVNFFIASSIPLIQCPSLIRLLRSKKQQQSLILSETFLTPYGIRHIQSKDPNASSPTGGEVFIPFEEIKNISFGTSTRFFGFSVTLVTIETTKCITKYTVSGCLSPNTAFWCNTTLESGKHITLLYGLSDPSSFQGLINERKESFV